MYYDAECTNYMNGGTTDASGKVHIPIHYWEYDTYYLKEVAPAAGYYPNETIYTVKAETVYVVRNAGTADAYTEKQQILTVSGLDTPAVDPTNEIKYTYTVENTAIKPVTISVEKKWDDGGYHARPEEVTVTLYRDGAEYSIAYLNEENDWSYVWSGVDFTDAYTWTVDEPSVPSGYNKTVRQNGTTFTITNIHEDNPKTGIFSMGKHWSILPLLSLAVCMTAGFFAILPRKKGKFER